MNHLKKMQSPFWTDRCR